MAKKSKEKVAKAACQFFEVPRYTGPNKKKTTKDKWCFVHAQWNCKDGIIKT